jgi:hypothetical protein
MTMSSAFKPAARIAAALFVVALPLLAGCASYDDSPVVKDLRAAESHTPAEYQWQGGQTKPEEPWGGCPDTYRGWC